MQFTFNGKKYIISTRKISPGDTVSARGKSSLYLLQVQADGRRKYLSSLYPAGRPNQYRFEVNGLFYVLDLGSTRGSERIFRTCTPV